ncbi:MAG: hypothetical protein ACI90V_012188, partial [Bacillariaceae sp.]
AVVATVVATVVSTIARNNFYMPLFAFHTL